MSHTVRRRVVYHGDVQGVGFRATTVSIASRFDVSGYVRNLPDGTVELVADGPIGAVEGFLIAIGDRFSGHVIRADVEDIHGGEAFSDFSVRR